MKSVAVRTVAFIAAAIGAMGSLTFMFYVGRSQQSIVLMILFTGWVALPFVALAIATVHSSANARMLRLVCHLTVLIAVSSLVEYGYIAFGPPRSKPAFWFMIWPAYSWILIVIPILVMSKRSRHV